MNSPGFPGNVPRSHKYLLPIRYLLVLWLLALSAVAFLDRTNISVAGLQIGREFGIDNAHLGWVFSAFLLGYAAFQIPGGVLVDRFGPRRILTLSVLWWGVFTALTAVVPSGIPGALAALVLTRFLLGAGEATMYPATNQFVERWFPVGERGRANGIIFGGVGLGSSFAPPLVTALILKFGWRASFWICGAIGIVAGLIWYVVARDSPERHPAVSSGELTTILSQREDRPRPSPPIPSRSGDHSADKHRIPWARILRSREVFGLTISYFSFGYIAWIFFSWFYIYLVQVRRLNLRTTALYSMLPFIAMALGSVGGGVVSDWIARRYSARAGRCYFPAAALAVTALLLILGAHAAEAHTATIVLAFGAGALYLSQSCFWSVSADFGGEHAGVVSGMMNTGCQIGGAVTASLTPLIAAHVGWNASFLTAAALGIIGGLAWLMVNPRRRLAAS